MSIFLLEILHHRNNTPARFFSSIHGVNQGISSDIFHPSPFSQRIRICEGSRLGRRAIEEEMDEEFLFLGIIRDRGVNIEVK